MTISTRPPRITVRAATVSAALGALVLLAACTSDSKPAPSSGPSSGPSSSATSSAPTSRSTSSSSSTGGPAGFGSIDTATLVLGPTRDHADVYRVSGGRIVRVTKSARATAVSSNDGRTAVGVEGPGDRESVQELRGSRLTGIAADGFDPAVSTTGALARVRLESGSSTPGISKPGGFALVVRKTFSGRDRVVLTQRQSMGSPGWVDADHVVVAVGGDSPKVVRVDVRNGKRNDLGTVDGADDLDLTAGRRVVAVATDGGGVLINLDDRDQHAFPRGWTPLCWPTDSSVLATRSGRLATVPVGKDGSAGTLRVLGTLPAGTSAYAAGCGTR